MKSFIPELETVLASQRMVVDKQIDEEKVNQECVSENSKEENFVTCYIQGF